MMKEMRSHKKEAMQSQRVKMALLKFNNLKLKNTNGLSPTENLKIYLNFS
jgi:hypothetical protein